MAATTRDKAPARWAVLLVSGLASAGFLWGIVNAPGSAGASSSGTSSTALTAQTPAASQQVVSRGDDGGGVTSFVVPSSQSSTTGQQSTQPQVSTARLRTRAS